MDSPGMNFCKTFSVLFLLSLFLVPGIAIAQTELPKLIEQLKGINQYYDSSGKPLGWFASWSYRHFTENSRIWAVRLIEKNFLKEPKAIEALIDAFLNGPEDRDTGDGILKMRTAVALILGKSQNSKAIKPLISGLKKPGLSIQAIVIAIGLFAGDAIDALGPLKDLKTKTRDKDLLKIIDDSIERIEKDKKPDELDLIGIRY